MLFAIGHWLFANGQWLFSGRVGNEQMMFYFWADFEKGSIFFLNILRVDSTFQTLTAVPWVFEIANLVI